MTSKKLFKVGVHCDKSKNIVRT